MSLGETIRALRSERALSQSELAEKLQVSRQSVSKWETDSAVPELNKLVQMAELFGVTLDQLAAGGAAPAQTPCEPPKGEAARPVPPRRTAGIVLLGVGALLFLLPLLLQGALGGLLLAAPFLLCGLICLFCRRRAGLWCGWAAYLCVNAYLRYATGVTWSIVFTLPYYTADMNDLRLAVGFGMLLTDLLLLGCTLRSYRSLRVRTGRRPLTLLCAGTAALAGLSVLQNRAVMALLPKLPALPAAYLLTFLSFFGDVLRLGLLTALLVLGAALLRAKKGR